MTLQYRRRRASLTVAAATAGLLALPLAALATQTAAAAPPPSSGCAAVETIAVRGTTEPGTVGGGLTPLADAITAGTAKTVSTYGVPYPATADWATSVASGVSLLKDRVARSAASCPEQRFVLLGYSQGAWVVGDALAGGSPLAASLGAKVAAVVLYGDPRFVAGEPFDAGTFRAGVNGVYPRAKGALSTYAARTRSYCDAGDTVCQNGASGTDHITYGRTKTAEASAFVLGRLGSASTPADSGGSPTTAPTAPTAPTTQPSTPPTAAPSAPSTGSGGLLGLLRKWFPWFSFFGA